jgi:hypothetical protein
MPVSEMATVRSQGLRLCSVSVSMKAMRINSAAYQRNLVPYLRDEAKERKGKVR